MSNCTQQSAGCQKGRPIKAGRLYNMKLLLITQSQKQKTNRQKYRQTDRHTNRWSRQRFKLAHKCIPYNNRCVQNFIQIGWDLAVRGPKTCSGV